MIPLLASTSSDWIAPFFPLPRDLLIEPPWPLRCGSRLCLNHLLGICSCQSLADLLYAISQEVYVFLVSIHPIVHFQKAMPFVRIDDNVGLLAMFSQLILRLQSL